MSETKYIASRCANCGMINIMSNRFSDGAICIDCGGGPLIPMGYAKIHKNPINSLTVDVIVKRNQLDRLIDDVKMVNDRIDIITDKMKGIGRTEIK